ncbi:hypothetical protein EUTSA_v10013849mg [Eutrema salsugineum]|uniref:C2 domain-containing protein n=1 Tax=Eutrema salsugineum TaxID=72664 RepID=V4LFK0_EUTSA|nr:probable basic-leucine zipper transcription factor D [Eutrema salsugineum]ESQ41197.1 hypothetical protein EUTSA_v10013849mg [Eutrema salsugineum]
MESLKQASSSRFCYHQSFSGVLQVFVHNARNIHNICIYDNQDVYAKFSLTYNPDDTISTRIIHRAGKNPEFNQKLMIDVTQIEAAVLKCEIWMMSRARHYMEDQLLGFALVPISDIIGRDSVTQDYSLSSTDLFHSPAGTVKLTLSIVNPSPDATSSSSSNPKINTSISSEVVLLDPQVSETVDYTRIEFPDINVVNENKQMVTEYFNGLNLRPGTASFLCLGSTHLPETDITMVCLEDKELYGNGSFMASSSTTTSLSDEKNTADSNEKENREMTGVLRRRSKEGEEDEEEKKMNVETEETSMQKQIADMYMRSMQQFTESLAKMKLPMDHNNSNNNTENQIQNRNNNNNANNNNGVEKKKEGSRVFYGSRAFF